MSSKNTTPAQLPPEIWRLIIRRATHTPGLLATSWDYDPEDRIWEDWPEEKSNDDQVLDKETDTKRTIVQVCREWQAIGIEFLYEIIHIRSSSQTNPPFVCSLIRTLAGSVAESSPSRVGYGWWTKRITCQYRDFSDDHAEHMFALLEQCHNLQIFTFSAKKSVPPAIQVRFAHLLESRFSHSLRRLKMDLSTSLGLPSPDVIPRITGLTSLGTVMADGTPNPTDDTLFKHITALSINFQVHSDSYNFPSQTTLRP